MNIGTGRETSVLDLVEALGDLAGEDGFRVEHAPARTGEIQRSWLDVTRARDELG